MGRIAINGLGDIKIMDNLPEIPTSKDEAVQQGLKLLDHAVSHFMGLDDDHSKALTAATMGVLNLGLILFNIYKKD